MRRGWLSGKPHPVTGAPMECEEVRLPPGSLVACVSHAAHRVNPIKIPRVSSAAAIPETAAAQISSSTEHLQALMRQRRAPP